MKTYLLFALIIGNNQILEVREIYSFDSRISCNTHIEENGEPIIRGIAHMWQGQKLDAIGLYCKQKES